MVTIKRIKNGKFAEDELKKLSKLLELKIENFDLTYLL